MSVIHKKQNDCCGCRACESACPKQCIRMEADNEGFLVPIIDETACVNCGLCEKVCAFSGAANKILGNFPIKATAAVCFDTDVLARSTSGGAFLSICSAVDKVAGTPAIVYGAAFDDKLCVVHSGVEQVEQRTKFQKSKYVQSDVKQTYQQTKDHLLSGKVVIYSGTPCQIGALKAFLGKDYQNLYTIDLICHGVPSQKFFDSYLEHLSHKDKTKVGAYCFRSRQTLLGDTAVGIEYMVRGKRKFKCWGQDPFMNVYLKGLCYRSSCYKCPYASEEILRPADFTIADCWGVDKIYPDLHASNGVSTILFNTEKAMALEATLREIMDLRPLDLSFVTKNNKNLVKPNSLPQQRDGLYEGLKAGIPFKQNVDRYIKSYGKPHLFGALKRLILKR